MLVFHWHVLLHSMPGKLSMSMLSVTAGLQRNKIRYACKILHDRE